MVYENGIMSTMYGTRFGMYGFFGFVINILVIVALVLLIIWLVRKISEKPKK